MHPGVAAKLAARHASCGRTKLAVAYCSNCFRFIKRLTDPLKCFLKRYGKWFKKISSWIYSRGSRTAVPSPWFEDYFNSLKNTSADKVYGNLRFSYLDRKKMLDIKTSSEHRRQNTRITTYRLRTLCYLLYSETIKTSEEMS
jgi:hypothetical protein